MTKVYDLASRFCGTAAMVCLVLAFMAYPSVSRADDPSHCYDVCGAYSGTSQFYDCFNACYTNGLVCSGGPCDNGCSGSFKTGCNLACNNSGGKIECTDCRCEPFGAAGCTCTW